MKSQTLFFWKKKQKKNKKQTKKKNKQKNKQDKYFKISSAENFPNMCTLLTAIDVSKNW